MREYYNNSVVTRGNNNTVIVNRTDDTKWNQLEDDFIDLITKVPKDSVNHKLFKDALKLTVSKDKPNLINFIKDNSKDFLLATSSGIASTVLADFVKSALGM